MKRHEIPSEYSEKSKVPEGHIVNQGDYDKTPEHSIETRLPEGHIALVGDIEKPTSEKF